MDWPTLLTQLAQPFPASAIYWRAGSVSRDKQKAQALPYAEPRVYEDRLNAVCPDLWSVSFRPWGETRIICDLTVQGSTRSSTGEFAKDDFAPGTSAEAQAFKRACVKFGLGRYLYDVPIHWVGYDERTRKLTETPTLPKQFLPKVPTPSTGKAGCVLSKERAAEMHLEMGRKNLINHYGFASQVLGREVSSYEGLSEAEALEVWNAALRESRVPGSAWIREKEPKAA